jgi:tetratricopeptide (TPR) repeat protein
MRAFIYQNILEALKDEIAVHPEYADLHYHYAVLLIMKGDWAEGRQSLRNSLKINPRYQNALEVEKDLKSWAAKDINDEKMEQNVPLWLSDAHITAARYYAQCGDIKDAESALQKAYSLTQDKALYSYHCGLLYESRGLLQQAETYLKKAISLEIECCNPYLVLSQILALEDKWEEAKKILKEALLNFPHYPDLHYQYGVLLMQEGDLDGAIKELRRAVKINPDYLFAHYQLGNLLIQKGEAQGAVEEYKMVMDLGLKESQIYMDLASAQLMGDMEPEAEQTAKEAMLVDSSNPEPCRFLEVLYRIRGDHKLADYYNLEKLKREEHNVARR